MYKLPLVSNVTATSTLNYYAYIYYDYFRVENIFAYQYPLPEFYYSWCSGDTNDMPNVTIVLTEPVVLHGLLSGGLESQYVSNFSMEYSESEEGELVQHDPLGNLLVSTLCACMWLLCSYGM